MDDFLRHLSCKLSVNQSFHSLHHLLLWKSPVTISPFSSNFVSTTGCDGQMGSWSVVKRKRREGDAVTWMTTKAEMLTLEIIMMGVNRDNAITNYHRDFIT